MKTVSLTGVLAGALGLMMAGCMSMDEMLASEDGFWRDIGETKAVSFALDDANPLEKRLEVVPKIANQQKLAKIYVAKCAAPEVRASARKGISDKAAFEWMFLNTKDAAIRNEALDNMKLDDDGLMSLAIQLARSDKAGACDLAARMKDNSKLSKAVVAKAKEAYKLQKEIVEKEQVGGYRNNPSKFNSDIDKLDRLYKSFVALAPLARDMEVVGEFCGSSDVQKTRGKEEQYDFYTPFEQGMRDAFIASLTDEDRLKAMQNDSVTKSESRNPVRTLRVTSSQRAGKADMSREPQEYQDPSVVKMTEKEVLAGFKNKQLAADAIVLRNVSGLKFMMPADQLAKVKSIKNDELRKKVIFEFIDGYKSFDLLKDEHFKMLETVPVKELAAQLRWAAKEMKGNVQQFRLSGPASAKAIKDQAVIKDLLLDNPDWAYEMGLEEDFGKAYTALLENLTDEEILEEVFRKGKPDEYDRIASKWTLRNLFKRLSAERQEKIRAEVKNRADEQAKKSVVVKGFYLGMSLADFCVVNDLHGMPATANVDQNEKVTFMYFDNDKRDGFLNVGKGMDGIAKFKSLYCQVPDGVDLSQNDRAEMKMVMRSIKHLNFDNSKPGKYWWEYSNFAKYVDHPHNFQAEIQDENGQLTLRYPVDEGVISNVDKTKEEQNDLLNAFF